MRIIHAPTGTVLGENVRLASTFWSRLVGLMFVESPAPYDGLYITHANSVHNCFVRFSLDVIFVNDENKVVKVLRDFKPWRFSLPYFRARHAIEFPAGKVPAYVVAGDALTVET